MEKRERKRVPKPRKRGWVATALQRYLTFVNYPIYFRNFYVVNRELMPEDGTPTVLVQNHQNCLIDPLGLVFIFSDRKPRFLSRASIFKNPVLGKIFRNLGLLPTYRAKVDGVRNVAKNKGTLEEVAKSLLHGETVCLYPEGQHQNKRWLGPFSQAYLKMAFGAAEESGLEREVYVMPTAHHYSNYRLPREDMMVMFGEPVALSPYYEEYKTDPRGVMSKVNDIVRERILGLMLNIDDLDHYAEIDFLREGSFGKEWAEKQSLNPAFLPEKLSSDKSLVAALAKALEERPEQMAELYEKTHEVAKKMRKMGIGEWLFERKATVGGLVLGVAIMLLLLPLFLSAFGASWLVFLLPTLINHFLFKDKQFYGSINLAATLLVTYPLCGIVPVVVTLCKAMWLAALGWLVAFPFVTMFAYYYMRGAVKLLQYARFVLGDRKRLEKLAQRRAELYAELREVLK